LTDLGDFRRKLERIDDGKDREARIHVRWKSREEQPKGWRPDINEGVKVNYAKFGDALKKIPGIDAQE